MDFPLTFEWLHLNLFLSWSFFNVFCDSALLFTPHINSDTGLQEESKGYIFCPETKMLFYCGIQARDYSEQKDLPLGLSVAFGVFLTWLFCTPILQVWTCSQDFSAAQAETVSCGGHVALSMSVSCSWEERAFLRLLRQEIWDGKLQRTEHSKSQKVKRWT